MLGYEKRKRRCSPISIRFASIARIRGPRVSSFARWCVVPWRETPKDLLNTWFLHHSFYLKPRGRHLQIAETLCRRIGGALQRQYKFRVFLAQCPNKPLSLLWKRDTVSSLSKGKRRNGVGRPSPSADGEIPPAPDGAQKSTALRRCFVLPFS